jgi:hypothetical protein
MAINIDALNEYQKILRQREQEERKRKARRERIDTTKAGKIYWPSEKDPLVWCWAKDEVDFWKGITNFAQYAYDKGSPEFIPKYVSEYDSRGYAGLTFKLLSDKWNNQEFQFEFIDDERTTEL